jgi:putative phosphoesterase
MRYGIFSDIHANLEALEAVIEAFKNENIDKYFCLGDFVGYGADPVKCVSRVRSLDLTAVAGNHDRGVVGLFPERSFNRQALEALRWTKDHLTPQCGDFLISLGLLYEDAGMTLVHGTLEHPENFDYMLDERTATRSFALLHTGYLFVGHTHVPGIYVGTTGKDMQKYIVNVGSVGQPRDNNPQAAYCVYDTDTRLVRIKRVAYDVETARKKIIGAGLPRILGDRLLSGR